ncbi:YafY family protein [Brevibacillus sp. FSL K6-0770]|uniref:helix-turn-helix transcriptional regulator n=1 Tax=Brevibacillus sp. FSL K6-0770 TaxID=2954673 RepID=UPI0030FCDA33
MRVNRLLSMLLILSQKGMVTGKELADHFEVSLRTIYRDIEKIGEAGIPIASLGGRGGGYYLMEHYQVDNLFLNKEEANLFLAVVNDLDFLFGKNEAFNDVLLKLGHTWKRDSGAADKWSVDMSHFSMEEELREYLLLMNRAITENRLLHFEYINRNMDAACRVAEPVQIAFTSGHWFLVAFCRVRNQYRRFKLVRMRNLTIGEVFAKRAASREEIAKTIEASYQERGVTVTLRFSSRIGEQLTEYFSKESITKGTDSQYIVVKSFPYEEGLLKFILGFGKDCEIVEPHFLREELKEYVRELLLSYNG